MKNELKRKPENLDPTRLHTPAEVRRWKDEVHEYHEEQRKLENAAREKAAAPQQARYLSEDEYYELAVKRQQEVKAKAAAREAEANDKRAKEIAYMESSPDMAEIYDRSEFGFLLKLQHWIGRGYEVKEDSVVAWMPGWYAVKLTKQSTAAKKIH